MQITARPTGPQPITIATSRFLISARRTACQPTAIGSVSALSSGGEAVGDGEHQRLLDDDLLRIGAGRRGREADRVHLAAAPEQRQRDHGRAGRRPSAGSRPVVGDLAAELVAEHDLLVGAHEAVVAGLRGHIRRPRRRGGGRGGRTRRSHSAGRRSATWPLPGWASGRSTTSSLECFAGDGLHVSGARRQRLGGFVRQDGRHPLRAALLPDSTSRSRSRVTTNSIVASTLTCTGMPLRCAPKT